MCREGEGVPIRFAKAPEIVKVESCKKRSGVLFFLHGWEVGYHGELRHGYVPPPLELFPDLGDVVSL